MPANSATKLTVALREPAGSRTARRLRRTGQVPGVIYGGGEDPVSIEVEARTLRNALASGGAVIELSVDGGGASPVVLKELTRHPVNGEAVHVDLLRVRMDQPIQATVVVDLTGGEEAPGVKAGGVLEQVTRELNIEALPGDIPDTVEHDVSTLEIGDMLTVAQLALPSGVTVLDDPETTILTLQPPRLQVEEDSEIETETEVVGQETPEGDADAESADGGSGEAASDSE